MAHEVVVGQDGTVRVIYSDALAPMMQSLGSVCTARASHVEPGPGGKWHADMGPVSGPVLGPFETRAAALAAEVEWLLDHGTPVPKEVV